MGKYNIVILNFIYTEFFHYPCNTIIYLFAIRKEFMKKKYAVIFLAVFAVFMVSQVQAGDNPKLSKGETVYVAAYSHIYIGHKGKPYNLTITLSIRNIDPSNPITITKVDYFETQGKLLKNFITEPVILGPLASTRFIIPLQKEAGGSGANFIVKWTSKKISNPPIIESIMIGTQSQQGISFTSRGQVIIDQN